MTTPTIERHCHWLRKNSSSKRPEYLLFVDAESTLIPTHDRADQHVFRLGWGALCHYTPERGMIVLGWYEITDLTAFWQTIAHAAESMSELYVITHNVDYDARVLHAFSILPRLGYPPRYCIIADSCAFFSFGDATTKINLLDNLNYWPFALADLGQEFGIPKLEIDFATCSDRELSVYCKRDVEILIAIWRHWLTFLDKHHLGDWSITIAGQAWNAYRHRFMTCKIGIHNRADAIRLERESYKGGRCEIWKLGKFLDGPFYKLDVNGLYAYCMKAFKYPSKLVKVLTNVTPAELTTLISRYLCIADVILETDQPVYAITLAGYNVFPTGTFRTCLTTFDLVYALEHDHIRAIGEVAIYEPADLFSQFIDYFTPLRQEHKARGETAQSLICKQIRNSLYGKFGQRGYKQEIIADAPIDEINVIRWVDSETGDRCVDWTFGGKTIRQYYTDEGKDSFPAIAAHVSAAGRQVLWLYAQSAGLENVYYSDTDSLIVNQAGYDNLQTWIDPLKLGYLKVEGKSADLEIAAKKHYIFDGQRTIKGIRKNAQAVKPGTWRQTHFTSIKSAFASHDLDDVISYEVEKTERASLLHAQLGPGNTVLPASLWMDARQVGAIIAPQNPILWNWWMDSVWYQHLETRERDLVFPLSHEQPPPDLAV